jgi:hypothetical protein
MNAANRHADPQPRQSLDTPVSAKSPSGAQLHIAPPRPLPVCRRNLGRAQCKGGLILIAVLVVLQSHAEIHSVTTNAAVYPPSSEFRWDVDGTGSTDVLFDTIWLAGNGYSEYLTFIKAIVSAETNAVETWFLTSGTGSNLVALTESSPVGPEPDPPMVWSTALGSWNKSLLTVSYEVAGTTVWGPWAGLTNRYMGLKLRRSGVTTYGWIKLRNNPGSDALVLEASGWEGSPDTPIHAGRQSSKPAFVSITTDDTNLLLCARDMLPNSTSELQVATSLDSDFAPLTSTVSTTIHAQFVLPLETSTTSRFYRILLLDHPTPPE